MIGRLYAPSILLMLGIMMPANGDTIAYWRLENGVIGNEATTSVSKANSPLLNGTESGTGASSMTFSGDVPDAFVQYGIAGSAVPNTSSLYTERVGNNRFDVDDNTNSPALHEPTSFTYELFVKADLADVSEFRVISRKTRNTGDGSWFLMANAGRIGLRTDTNVSGSGGPGHNEGVYSNVSVHGSLDDGEWHHLAVTYEEITTGTETAGLFQLFKDYTLVGTLNPNDDGANKIVYDGGVLHIGGRDNGNGWQGWIDEIRFTDSVLTTDQFLRAVSVPEPSSITLFCIGALWIVSRRIRNRRRAASAIL